MRLPRHCSPKRATRRHPSTSPWCSSACTRRTSRRDSTASTSTCLPRTSPSSKRSRTSRARTVVVLSNGGVVTLEPWHDSVDAIVEGWALGQAVGSALADVLTGAMNPSGRLAETIPLALADTPSYLNFPGETGDRRGTARGSSSATGTTRASTGRCATRSATASATRRSTYESFEVAATGRTPPSRASPCGTRADVAGAEVVQLYVAPAPSEVRRPGARARRVREGHARARRGDHGRSSNSIGVRSRYWDARGSRWWVDPGTYRVELGAVGGRHRSSVRDSPRGRHRPPRTAQPRFDGRRSGSATRSSARR